MIRSAARDPERVSALLDAIGARATRPWTLMEVCGGQTHALVRSGLLDRLPERVDLLLDSKLIVEQLHGRWRVKDAKLAPLHAEAKGLLAGFQTWSAAHVPRAQNSTADRLANEALDRVAAGGPARVARARRIGPAGGGGGT